MAILRPLMQKPPACMADQGPDPQSDHGAVFQTACASGTEPGCPRTKSGDVFHVVMAAHRGQLRSQEVQVRCSWARDFSCNSIVGALPQVGWAVF